MFVTILLSLLSAFSLVQGDRTARIVVDPKENASVVLAAEDLRSDVRKITGKELRIVRSSRPKKGDVYTHNRRPHKHKPAYSCQNQFFFVKVLYFVHYCLWNDK